MNNSDQIFSIYGFGGDSLMAPEHTTPAFWAALGGGANGFVVGVRKTKDNIIVCSNYDTLEYTCGVSKSIGNLNWSDIQNLDAGFTFNSTALDEDGQPTGFSGKDNPWAYTTGQKTNIPRLDEILIQFSRRCKIYILLPSNDIQLIRLTLDLLNEHGALKRTSIIGEEESCKSVLSIDKDVNLVLDSRKTNQSAILTNALKLQIKTVYLLWESLFITVDDKLVLNSNLNEGLKSNNIKLLLGSNSMPYSPKNEYIKRVQEIAEIEGIITKGVLPTIENFTPKSLVVKDNFDNEIMNLNLWTAGYSSVNSDTKIYQDNGLHIAIKEGGSYSGAAAICRIPIVGNFDAQVDFEVANPEQGTTFEIAAISIDPGYHHIDNFNLNTRNVNLTFDVHGAPPYASSERDEDDGFRCGWNNGFNLSRILENWEASSANMYNKYGRDVGYGKKDSPKGSLRLKRTGAVFCSYYRDKFNDAWVCSGVMLVHNLGDNIFIRLAAKHWAKGGKVPPSNKISFYNFKLFQF